MASMSTMIHSWLPFSGRIQVDDHVASFGPHTAGSFGHEVVSFIAEKKTQLYSWNKYFAVI